jgi:hypothetical protein
MNLSALRDRARALSGIRLQTLRSDEQIDAVINEAYHELIGLAQWPFLRSTAQISLPAGSDSFESPVGFSEVTGISFSANSGESVRLQSTTVDELDRLADESGEPFIYARVDDRNFVVWPSPNTSVALTIRGKSTVPSLSSDGDSPVFDEQFHPILSYRAAARMLAEEGDDSGRTEFYQSEANVFFTRMQQFYLRSGDVGVFVMGGRRRRYADGR